MLKQQIQNEATKALKEGDQLMAQTLRMVLASATSKEKEKRYKLSKEKPELITKSADAVNSAKNKTKLLCGAGIVSGQDVTKALELGSRGILVASGIIKAKNWTKVIEEFSKAML